MFTILGQRLEQLSLPELQRALLTYAGDVPADERRAFLDTFISPGNDSAGQSATAQLPRVARDLS